LKRPVRRDYDTAGERGQTKGNAGSGGKKGKPRCKRMFHTGRKEGGEVVVLKECE